MQPIPRTTETLVAYDRARSEFLRRNTARLGDVFRINDSVSPLCTCSGPSTPKVAR
jgi:hypothetical protein